MLRKSIVLGIVIFTIYCLCACGKNEEIEPVEIILMHGWGGTLQTHEIMQEIYEEFDKMNPDIKLNCVPYSSNIVVVEKANDMLSVGNVPDILSTNGLSYYVSNAVKCGEAMDLMPYIEVDESWEEQIHPAVLEMWKTEDGALYTIPDAMEVAGYWYNEEHFKEAGIVDENGEVLVPTTWDEFMDAVSKIQEWIDESKKGISVFALEQEQVIEFLFLARLAGGSEDGLAMAQEREPEWNQELIEDALGDIANLYQYTQEVNNLEDARQGFRNGMCSIYFNGAWEADELNKGMARDNLKYACYPTYDGRSLSYVSPSSGYVLSNQTDERKAEACIRFLKYMVSEEVQEKIALETGQAPSNPKMYAIGLESGTPLFVDAIEEAEGAEIQIATIRSVWNEEKMDEINQYLIQWIENVRN